MKKIISGFLPACLLIFNAAAENLQHEYECMYTEYTPIEISDAAFLSGDDLGFLRNEIYARYGRTFSTDKYRSFFRRQKWYSPDSAYSDARLTDTDRENIKLIQSLENPSNDDKNSESLLISGGEREIIVAYPVREYIEPENDDEHGSFSDKMINSKMKVIFSSENRCIVKGDFNFIPYLDSIPPVPAFWRIHDNKLYIKIFYKHSWFDESEGYSEFKIFSKGKISGKGSITMTSTFVYY